MLKIHIEETELFDENKNEFIQVKAQDLCLEHSLVSIKKWESVWHIPFLSSKKTNAQIIDYIRYMTITQNVSPYVYMALTQKNIDEINDYINDPSTATTFSDLSKNKKKGKKEILTNELIYYYMFSLSIPKECEKWHINSLITLLKIFEYKNGDQKKMSRQDIYANNKVLNAARKARLHTRG